MAMMCNKPHTSGRTRKRSRKRSHFVSMCGVKVLILAIASLQSFDNSRAWSVKEAKSSRTAHKQELKWERQTLSGQPMIVSTSSRKRTRLTGTSITTSATEDMDITNNEISESEKKSIGVEPTAWEVLAGNVATCLIASDQKRATGMDGGSTGWTSWIEESSAFRLQQCVNRLVFGEDPLDDNDFDRCSRDETLRWLKWMKAAPAPMVVELSEEFRDAVDSVLSPTDYIRAGMVEARSRADFLSRIGCRLVVLPSGESLRDNLKTPPGAMVYGKLLYGGVTRYRILGGAGNNGGRRPPRRAGERTSIMPLRDPNTGTIPSVRGWLQYGGPERNYQAVDMGPCGLMEITILPKDLKLGLLTEKESSALEMEPATNLIGEKGSEDTGDEAVVVERQPTEEMVVSRAASFDPKWLFTFPPGSNDTDIATDTSENKTAIDDDMIRYTDDPLDYGTVDEIEEKFSTVLGGLQPEIESIIRRVLDGRRRSTESGSSSSELQTMLEFGLTPVRGLLLYGKPGCGKTALAREISRLLTDRPPKIVAAPELLDRWVGGTESSVRSLFEDAEAELKVCGGDASKSGLHVVVIDEIDAVFRQRSSSSGSGEVARASAVNQILAKLDGVQALGNILVIGTTNRRELLDDALLRPGRLEVKIEVPLPDREGRREILNIYFGPLRSLGRLSQPLCRAIDGSSNRNSRVASEARDGSESSRVRSFFNDRMSWKSRSETSRTSTIRDLAADRWTGGFSGADIEGLVRCAGSIALSRARKDGSGVDGLLITTEDVIQALREVKQ